MPAYLTYDITPLPYDTLNAGQPLPDAASVPVAATGAPRVARKSAPPPLLDGYTVAQPVSSSPLRRNGGGGPPAAAPPSPGAE